MVVAGAFLAFVLPAMPFIRFLFGILTWLVTVVVALLAVTVWAAAHMAGGEGDRLVTGATRNGWLFLPGVFLRPPLMVFGLVLGYFVFLAVMERFNQVWMIHLQGTNLAHSVGVVGYLAYLMLYVIVAYALLNGALKLIDVLPSATLEWIGGRAGAAEQDSDRVGGAAAAGLFRAGGLRVSPIRRSG